MRLGDLLRELAGGDISVDPSDREKASVPSSMDAGAAPDADVSAIAYDSRQSGPSSIFVALRGEHADGSLFAREAVKRGALAVVSEAPRPADITVPWVRVADARLALAALAAALDGRPSEELTLVGITGTNGKTTTSYLLASIFEAAGVRCGRIGTVGHRVGNREIETSRTTPEAPELQRMLREMVTAGCGACVMEVSSHGLALRRAEHLHFAAGIFTNLTRDHLDFHGDMEEYFLAKRRLFALLPAGAVGIANLDDRRGAEFAAAVSRPVTYAIDAAADVRPGPLTSSLEGLAFEVRTPRGTLHLRSPLVGRPNAYNILAAVAAAMALDVPFSAIEQGISRLASVPGRFQVVSDPGDDVRVVVDYAHTDDALKNLLETARPLAKGRIITVFGRRRSRSDQAAADGCGGSTVERPRDSHVGQPSVRRSRADHRRNQARPRDAAGSIASKRPPRADLDGLSHDHGPENRDRARRPRGAPWRPRADRRQGARKVPGRRGTYGAVRRRGGRARDAGAASDGLESVVTG